MTAVLVLFAMLMFVVDSGGVGLWCYWWWWNLLCCWWLFCGVIGGGIDGVVDVVLSLVMLVVLWLYWWWYR